MVFGNLFIYLFIFEYIGTLHLFQQIYSNLLLYKMKWNIYFSIFPRLYSNIIWKNIVKFFKSLRWNTLKHAHPWKVIQCDTPKGVTIMCFHLGNKKYLKNYLNKKYIKKKNFLANDHGSFQTNPSNSKLGKCHYCGAKRH
jgi:hypothetical protein